MERYDWFPGGMCAVPSGNYVKSAVAHERLRDMQAEIDRLRAEVMSVREQTVNDCLHALMCVQDEAKSGEGVVVTVGIGAGRGAVYVPREAAANAMRDILTRNEAQ